MTKDEFLSGAPFYIGDTRYWVYNVASNKASIKRDGEHHCNIDIVGDVSVRVYKNIMGRTVYQNHDYSTFIKVENETDQTTKT